MTRGNRAGFSLLELIVVVAVTLVLATMTVSGFLTFKAGYDYNTTARELAAVTQKARGAASSQNTRYRVNVDSANAQYQMEKCTTPNLSTLLCDGWTMAADPGLIVIPRDVTITTTGVTTSPAGFGTVAQSQYTIFNSRGILVDSSGNALSGSCVYLAGKLKPPTAVCTTLAGRTGVYRYTGGAWIEQ